MNSSSRPRAAFGVAKKDAAGVLVRAMTMYNAMTTNAAMFVSPTIALAAFLALVTAFSVAQQHAVGTKAKGSATLRDTKRDAVWTAMESLRTYVQGLADGMTADGAASVIEAAGLLVAAVAAHQKDVLKATLTTTLGVVHLDANASVLVGPAAAHKKVTFHWQMSADGGATWTDLRSTPYASTDVPGVTLMSTCSFRVSVTIGRTPGAWSQAISLLVH
jgi:hypothetical protein